MQPEDDIEEELRDLSDTFGESRIVVVDAVKKALLTRQVICPALHKMLNRSSFTFPPPKDEKEPPHWAS